MREQMSLMEKCHRCGGLFDLKYDMQVLERNLSKEEAMEKVVCELKEKDGVLCWDCRS